MPTFYGECKHQLDDKGRFRIPSDYREQLGADAMMFVGFEHCIMIYTAEGFRDFVMKRFENADILNTKMSDLKRVLFSRTQKVEEDKQGRVLLKSNLAKLCNISKNLVSVGAMDHVELWDEATYEEHMAGVDIDAILAESAES